jgi:hypothetical protein
MGHEAGRWEERPTAGEDGWRADARPRPAANHEGEPRPGDGEPEGEDSGGKNGEEGSEEAEGEDPLPYWLYPY